MFRRLFEIDKPKLGRWSLKSCNEISTSINSVYQNRDLRRLQSTRIIQKMLPCMKPPIRIDCAVRHRRCSGCPYNKFFRPQETTKIQIKEKSNKKVCTTSTPMAVASETPDAVDGV